LTVASKSRNQENAAMADDHKFGPPQNYRACHVCRYSWMQPALPVCKRGEAPRIAVFELNKPGEVRR